ncbi:nuclease domain-containing protein [Companilactobacillus mishanensis]|uniref:DUF2357 domain-containing protein n=1 Tax=Companilactobacillus mishanensis TaxID=2486008 RepID=A0A5P0ZI87_9LACO|nr:nuclease domain-containing protein [Companilactobacillus mishanensis]MQS52728.1 hypothetical protein [Companilactobacillus mishanensis]
MDSQCKVIFSYNYNKRESSYECENFPTEESEISTIPKNSFLEYKEDHLLSIKFQSDNAKDRLYLDQLSEYFDPGTPKNNEALRFNPKTKQSKAELVDDNVVIKPGCSIDIIKESGDNAIATPYIGNYQFHVESDKKKYYSKVKISLKGIITEANLQGMVLDLENKVGGLALGFNKMIGLKYFPDDSISEEKIQLLAKLDDFIEQSDKLRFAINDFQNNMSFEIAKNHEWVNKDKPQLIDGQSVIAMNSRPHPENKTYSRVNELNYDVRANQYIKYILEDFNKFLSNGIKFYKKYIDDILSAFKNSDNHDDYFNKSWNELDYKYQLKELLIDTRDPKSSHTITKFKKQKKYLESLNDSKNKLVKFKGYLQSVLQDNKVQVIKSSKKIENSKAIMLRPNYNKLYKLHNNIVNKNYKLKLSNEFRFNYKNTSLLYELWGYVKIINVLIARGYAPQSGWIFEKESIENTIPFLEEGKSVKLFNEDTGVTLRIVYNDSVKDTNELIKMDNKFHRNKPDILMYVYKNNQFIGLIVFDTKYSPMFNVFKKKTYDEYSKTSNKTKQSNKTTEQDEKQEHESSCVKQFKSYRHGIVDKSSNPVTLQVFALLPTIQYQNAKGAGFRSYINDLVTDGIFPVEFNTNSIKLFKVEKPDDDKKVQDRNLVNKINTIIKDAIKKQS